MKKISRNIVVGLIFSAAGFVAVTAVPASAASNNTSSTKTVQADSDTTNGTALKGRVWEW